MDKTRFISGISMALLVTGLILFTPDMPLWFVFNIIISLCCLEFVRLRFSNLTASIWTISFFALAYLIKDLLVAKVSSKSKTVIPLDGFTVLEALIALFNVCVFLGFFVVLIFCFASIFHHKFVTPNQQLNKYYCQK